MPLPHRDPAITAYVRHVVIGLDNAEPTKVAARLGVSGAWVVNVRDGHRGVGLDALRKIAAADFDGSLDRLERAARDWSTAHPEAVEGVATPKQLTATKSSKTKPRRATPDSRLTSHPLRAGSMQLDNLRAARERLLERGYPRDAINEALLSPAVQDSSDVLLVFDLAERQLIASGYAAQMQNLLRRGRPVETGVKAPPAMRPANPPATETPGSPTPKSSARGAAARSRSAVAPSSGGPSGQTVPKDGRRPSRAAERSKSAETSKAADPTRSAERPGRVARKGRA